MFKIVGRKQIKACCGVRSIRGLSSKPPKADGTRYSSFSRNHMKSHSPSSVKINELTPKYIPFEKFPKAPESIMNQSVDELLSNINLRPAVEEQKRDKDHFINFEIPEKYYKTNNNEEITARDRELVEELDRLTSSSEDIELSRSQLSMLRLYYDQESDLYQPLPEHTLKKSLSGMIKLNKSLQDIDDEYLWKLIPKGKTFGVPPFEKLIAKDGFKKWESDQLKEKEWREKKQELKTKEFDEFLSTLKNTKTLFKSNSNGRRKLDRKLLRRYKQLKKEGKIPKDFKLNSSNDDDDL